jgi:hypothetical protein
MSEKNQPISSYEPLIINGVDFTHARLVDLAKLADQAAPFYAWIETEFQASFHSSAELQELILTASPDELKVAIHRCYEVADVSRIPKLYDGGGVPYKHFEACFFMFAWMARDAAVQRLRPLISQATKGGIRGSKDIEIEVLANLLFHYKSHLKFFDWPVVREVTIQRLEGSRRAKKGSAIEIYTRTALSNAFSFYFKTRKGYGKYRDFEIFEKPLKVNNRTYDVCAKLIEKNGSSTLLVIPVKTRETQGGGHAHLFSRDIEQANQEILAAHPGSLIAFVIIAQNWSQDEIKNLNLSYEHVFYFNQNPNSFIGFDELKQREMNILIERILDQ